MDFERKGGVRGMLLLTYAVDLEVDLGAHDLVPSEDAMDQLS